MWQHWVVYAILTTTIIWLILTVWNTIVRNNKKACKNCSLAKTCNTNSTKNCPSVKKGN